MIDLERAVGGAKGITELYEFTQTNQVAIIQFSVDNGIKPQILINQQEGSIYVISGENNVIISGLTYGKFYKFETIVENNKYVIKLTKENTDRWPILIKAPSMRGIDNKSLYLIGVYNDGCAKYEEAYKYYYLSATKGFVTAITTVADILLSDYNNYGVKKDVDAALKLLRTIKPVDRTTEVTQTLTTDYISQNKKEEAVKVMKEHLSAKEDLIVRFDLAKLLSPIAGGIGPATEAVESLKILVKAGNPEAMQLLAQHLYKGIGTVECRQKALELDAQACEINPNLKRIYGNNGIYQNIAIASATTFAFAGAIYYIWNMRNRH
ncbi:hypothetical protein TVAG_118260 [Trichomonas vaginalis G3]|uniref:Uncharacterized protein n=1 Tax=Trichomonas vaginalis (strain ATCC PRA-98 / G3) TaxID=412133 RepID=A2EI13_TRIV3|nr:tetratricopeptide repeat domain domain-containing protein [Trichomonas vaginalis G3]EAY07745.1 hypothetical protein TVAG_118260 [Trichomonas vaginalis G3]KAI5552592.1 tetratricopeptide repeat domain domain-containing protein [Trichomonas vaginalis G3]|eukprot:XP_001319968.1 hypothetical protein [Trichomonas vaginalis G3]